jgi:ribosomal protein S18 acetylase RimI-like enzyme
MIRHIQIKDKEQWEELFKGYADFYKVEMNDKILQTVWDWLHDKSHEVNGLVYEVDGNIVGLAHYRKMPRPLRGQDIGFLDDLFVDPKYRGQKIGEKLINKMKEISKSKGWNLVRWLTHDDNVRAKSLYDRVAKKNKLGCIRIKMKKFLGILVLD